MRNEVIQEDLEIIAQSNLPWSGLDGKVILISGANGFLPAYMVETLLFLNERKKNSEKIKVIGLVRNKDKAVSKFFHHQDRSDFQLVIQDVCQSVHIDGKIDYIVHAASQASPKYYGQDPVGTLSANVIGTSNLLELAKTKNSCGFMYFSSSEVYGQVDDSQIPTKESDYGYVDPTNVRSCYAESKRMGETISVSWFHQYGIPTKIVRPFHTYGPGMSLDDGRVYADFVADIIHSRDIVINSDGTATRAFCYLADAVQGFFTVMLKGENGEAYNVGNPECEISILDLANRLVNLFPEKGLKVAKKNLPNQGYIRSRVS
ncbi:NAD-dependent epimerase/dehydratase family protein, partial [Planktothrix sp.]|uniref:NAD-dependent epimerase/dehydratase family protein n=1 Tax=Planktothrix sp. TaxID=3088171 RepID=UPI0038D3D5D1